MVETYVTQTKEWYKSRTLWINVIAIVLAFLTQIQGMLEANQAITIMAIINILMRIITTTKLE